MRNLLLLTFEYRPPDVGGIADYLAGLWGTLPKDLVGDVVRLELRPRPLAWLRLWPRVWREVRRRQPGGIVISHLLPMGYFTLALRKLLGLPYVVIVHGTDLRRAGHSTWKRFWARRILQEAALVVANSHCTRALASDFDVPEDRLMVIHPGLAEHQMTPAPGFETRTPFRLLSVCRLVRRKGIERVLRVLPGLLVDFPDLKYVVVGDGPELPRLRLLAEELGVARAVDFTGGIPDERRERLYASASIFVLPGSDEPDDIEGFGIVFLEAAWHGLPVVAGAVSGTKEAVLDGRTGLLVDPRDPAALAAALSRLLTNPEEARLFGLAGHERVLAEFTWEHQARHLAERLQTL